MTCVFVTRHRVTEGVLMAYTIKGSVKETANEGMETGMPASGPGGSNHRMPRINRVWIEEMMQAASGPAGLTIPPEPAEDAVVEEG